MQRTGTLSPIEFYHHFQPVFDLHNMRVMGYEALMRSRTNLPPDRLLQLAKEQDRLIDVDVESVYKAISTFFAANDKMGGFEKLFVNVFPETIASDRFLQVMQAVRERYAPDCGRIVIEINETIHQVSVWNTSEFSRAIARIRQFGFQLAMDDVGEGTTNFRKMIELAPDYIKLDKFFAGGVCRSERIQQLIVLLVEYCRDHTRLILEGIENEKQYEMAVKLGVASGQGYWLGEPAPLSKAAQFSARKMK